MKKIVFLLLITSLLSSCKEEKLSFEESLLGVWVKTQPSCYPEDCFHDLSRTEIEFKKNGEFITCHYDKDEVLVETITANYRVDWTLKSGSPYIIINEGIKDEYYTISYYSERSLDLTHIGDESNLSNENWYLSGTQYRYYRK